MNDWLLPVSCQPLYATKMKRSSHLKNDTEKPNTRAPSMQKWIQRTSFAQPSPHFKHAVDFEILLDR